MSSAAGAAGGRGSPRAAAREGWVFFALLVASRVVLLAALALLTGRREFTSDAVMHWHSATEPFYILLGLDARDAHFPPLMPVLLAAAVAPFRALGPFLALRAGFALVELAAWPVVWTLLRRHVRDARARRWLAAVVVLSPGIWMATVVMAQEDIFSLLIGAVAAGLILSGRMRWAAFACGVGVVAAKVFFLVPLLAVVVAPGRLSVGAVVRRGLAGAVPIIAAYGVAGYFWWRNGMGFPLGDFQPPVDPSQSFWLLVYEWGHVPVATIRRLSMPTALLAGVLPLAIVKLRGHDCSPAEVLRLAAAMTMAVMVTFYLTMGEYYLVAVPMLLLAARPWLAVLTVGGLLTLSWAENWFYGVAVAKQFNTAAGGSVFVRMYEAAIPVAPHLMKQLSLVAFVAGTAFVAARLTWAAARREPMPHLAGPAGVGGEKGSRA